MAEIDFIGIFTDILNQLATLQHQVDSDQWEQTGESFTRLRVLEMVVDKNRETIEKKRRQDARFQHQFSELQADVVKKISALREQIITWQGEQTARISKSRDTLDHLAKYASSSSAPAYYFDRME